MLTEIQSVTKNFRWLILSPGKKCRIIHFKKPQIDTFHHQSSNFCPSKQREITKIAQKFRNFHRSTNLAIEIKLVDNNFGGLQSLINVLMRYANGMRSNLENTNQEIRNQTTKPLRKPEVQRMTIEAQGGRG